MFEQRATPWAPGGSAWHVWLESDPASAATGAPLIVVLALLLGHDPRPAAWPWWLYALVEDVETTVAVARARPPP